MDRQYRPRGKEWIRYRKYAIQYEISHRYEDACGTIADKLPKELILRVLAHACNAALYGEDGVIDPSKITYSDMYDAIDNDASKRIDKIRADAKQAIVEVHRRY